MFKKGAKLNLQALPIEKHPLPELGPDVFAIVRGMTALEAQVMQAAAKKTEDLTESDKRAMEKFGMKPEDPLDDYRFLAWILVNEDRTPVFTDTVDETGNVTKTAAQDVRDNFDVSEASIMGILKKSMDLSGISRDRKKN